MLKLEDQDKGCSGLADIKKNTQSGKTDNKK